MSSIYRKNKICAVIPFYNEERITEIIPQVLNYVDTVIAVDDGSTCIYFPRNYFDDRVILIVHPKNLGKGAAIKSGALESIKRNFDVTVTLDADFQHPPEYIPNFVSALKDFDIVIGNRLEDVSGMPLHRILSNKTTSFFLSLKTGVKIKDSQCGFRAFKTACLNKIMPEFYGFESESEMIVNAAKKNLKIGFVKIPTIYGDEKSKMKSFKTIGGFIKVLFRI